MPRLEIDKPLESNLEIGPERVERSLAGKGYRKTRKERMEAYKKQIKQRPQNDREL